MNFIRQGQTQLNTSSATSLRLRLHDLRHITVAISSATTKCLSFYSDPYVFQNMSWISVLSDIGYQFILRFLYIYKVFLLKQSFTFPHRFRYEKKKSQRNLPIKLKFFSFYYCNLQRCLFRK